MAVMVVLRALCGPCACLCGTQSARRLTRSGQPLCVAALWVAAWATWASTAIVAGVSITKSPLVPSSSELQGLSDWYVATNGSQWLDSAGWPATSCAALGVTCSSTGAVVYVRPVCRLHPFVFLLLIGLLTNDEHACVAGASLYVCAAAASS